MLSRCLRETKTWQRPPLLALACIATWSYAAPASGQAGATPSAWARAVDGYLGGAPEQAAAALRDVSPGDARVQARAALDGWMARARAAEGGPQAAAERRLAIRRVQASAALPLEIVSAVSTRTRSAPLMESYQDIAIDAWERLAAFEGRTADRAQLEHFRTWWRIGVLQYLVNVGRYPDFIRQARQVRLTAGDTAMRAEFHFLQGMVEEHDARSTSPVDRNPNRRLPDPRVRGATLTQDDAIREYRRALAAVPSHAEATLHLGRVLLERKRPDEAIDTLAGLVDRVCMSTLCALAALFTGEAHDVQGDFEKAAAAYARASSRQDVRQSAMVALVQLMVRSGDTRSGAGLLGHFAGTAPLAREEQPDAWSMYLSGRRQNIDAVLRPLREAMLP